MIIKSLLDTDLYKFTMMQLVFHHFKATDVEYEFLCRRTDIDFKPIRNQIETEIKNLEKLSFTDEELEYLSSLDLFKSEFIDHLKNFKFNFNYIDITNENKLKIKIKGPWLETILYEIPILAIVSEIYHNNLYPYQDFIEGKLRLDNKIKLLKKSQSDVKFVDFGTRRRYSAAWQDEIVETLKTKLPQNFSGTSNTLLAMKYNLPVIGTMAHEYLQACQRLAPSLKESQVFALKTWNEEYQGKLNTALTDVYNKYAFTNDLDSELCSQYKGYRHDSGDPYIWGDFIIEHLKKLGADPMDKLLVFSDSVTFTSMLEIASYFKDRINVTFGIGTHLTNDLGVKPPDIIIKMIKCNGLPVAKLTDSPEKAVCIDPQYLSTLVDMFGQNGK